MTPGDAEITVENNSSLQLQVQVQDKAGNVTVHPRLNVVCKVRINYSVTVSPFLYFQTELHKRGNTKVIRRGISALHPSNPTGLYVGGGGELSQLYPHDCVQD